MMGHQDNPVKYCFECKTHFKATPETHEETYHSAGQWMYVESSHRRYQRKRDRSNFS